jgi:ubiquinone biosynthesis protein COQ9
MPTLQDTLLAKLLEEAAFAGWTESALEKAAEAAGYKKEYGRIAFPLGIAEAASLYIKQCDEAMLAALSGENFAAMKIRERIAAAVWARLQVYAPHKEAVRGLVAYFSLPLNAARATKHLAATCSAIWYAAGDNATDYNWYTKRVLLAGVYSSTLLYWLKDESEGSVDTKEFLNRRIDNVMEIQKAKGRLFSWMHRAA